jgi:hypothetical protein
MKLISELTESIDYLVESSNGKKNYFIEGIFMQANKANRNGRIYPMPVMENAVNKYQNTITAKRAMGELGHPNGPTINLDRVSHNITNLSFQKEDVYGKAKILDTPMGKIAKNLIDEGIKLGVSSRGLGSLKVIDNGLNEVQEDFLLNTVDIVADPSAPEAWVNGILESKEWVMTPDGRLEERVIELAKKNKLTEERKVRAFQLYLNSLIERI